MDVALGRDECSRMRARATADLSGEVVEVGFGSGLNVPHYPPSVTRVLAVDPATIGRKLAAKRVAQRALRVDYIGLDGEHLPLDDDSVDGALSTWTLCTIPDAHRALTEIRRVLRPGGSLHFLEHGRSPDPEIARWQDRITPVQRRVAGGCHPNRPIADLVTDAGFDVTRIDRYYMSGPKSEGYMYEGVATRSS
jgi:ubiquinone/menaquinone biosynthesis C-methylase UbiE